jgi:hypothetical protein
LSRSRALRPSKHMRPKHVLASGAVIAVVACGVTSGEPIKPPAAAQTCEAGACGPVLGEPNYTCSDGTIAGPTGRCVLNQDGTCGWEIVACPVTDAGDAATCTDVQCGPRPLVADQACDGGTTTSGERCMTTNGSCRWVFVPCP